MSIAFVAITTGGKTSQILMVANALFPIMERIIIFSHSHRLDNADIPEGKAEAKGPAARRELRGAHLLRQPLYLPKVLSAQRKRV